jgi:hypothetical protein
MITPKFKVVTSNAIERFEERLNEFVESLDRDDMVVDIKFSTCRTGGDGIEYSALIQYQKTESWT